VAHRAGALAELRCSCGLSLLARGLAVHVLYDCLHHGDGNAAGTGLVLAHASSWRVRARSACPRLTLLPVILGQPDVRRPGCRGGS
jgi:hypothetical protein